MLSYARRGAWCARHYNFMVDLKPSEYHVLIGLTLNVSPVNVNLSEPSEKQEQVA